MKVSKWHLHAHRAAELKPATKLKVLQALDAFRQPEILEDYLIACQADATGRTGMQNNPYPAADIFRQAYEAATHVDVAALMEQGFTGAALGEAITKARVRAIQFDRDVK